MTDRITQLEKIQEEALELFKKKNADYGDAFANYGPIGVLVRIGDKIQRMQSISSKGITLIQDEKIRDTLIDLHNYAAMAIMLVDNSPVSSPPSSPIPDISIYPVPAPPPPSPSYFIPISKII